MPAGGQTILQNSNSVEKLWKIYTKTRNPDIKEKLMLHYMDYVRGIVRKMNLACSNMLLSEDDLFDIGIIGLSEAIDKFKPGMGVKFETYAFQRIRGVIIDEIRKLDYLPRSMRDKIDRIEEAKRRVENKLGDRAGSTLIAEEAEISLEKYHEIKVLENRSKQVSLSNEVGNEIELSDMLQSDEKNPEEELLEGEVRELIVEELEKLPEKKRLVMILYYYEELTFKEIAEILRLSESRVSQIHAEVIERIKRNLKSKMAK
jgi:RNA polymerase sigma factor for flagellar operon FliA